RAAVQLYDGSADRKAKAKPTLFRRKERLKDALLLRWRQSRTTIGYADHNSPLIGGRCFHRNCAPCRCNAVHCVHGVHEEIEKDLLQLDRIAAYPNQITGWFTVNRYSAIDQLTVQQPKSRSDQFIHIDRFVFDFALFQKAAKAVNLLPGAIIFSNDVVEYIADFGQVLVSLGQQDFSSLRI